MHLKSQKDLAAGLVFVSAGVAYGISASRYKMGTALEMGPGYFPLLLAVLLTVVGTIVTVLSFVGEEKPDDRIQRFRLRPVVCVLGGMAVFGLMLGGAPSLGISSYGLLAALLGLVFVVGLATPARRLGEIAITAAALAGMCFVIFRVLLRLPVPFWPTFL